MHIHAARFSLCVYRYVYTVISMANVSEQGCMCAYVVYTCVCGCVDLQSYVSVGVCVHESWCIGL